MYNNKRGQAALEFLMTYGWAILSAIIVIGALGSYFYINDGGTDRVIINEPFSGLASQVNATHVILEIENKVSWDLTSVAVNVSGAGCTETTIGDMPSSTTASIVRIPCSGISGSNFRGDITIKYLKPGSSLEQKATGQVSGPVA